MTDTSAAPDTDFETTMTFTSPPAAVFEALSTPAGLTGWWTTATGSGLEGGELTLTFGDLRKVMRVDEAEPASAVKWTVVSVGFLPEREGTSISFDLTPTETGGSRVKFRHAGLTPRLECFDSCNVGWTHYLASLVDYVDVGVGAPFGSA